LFSRINNGEILEASSEPTKSTAETLSSVITPSKGAVIVK